MVISTWIEAMRLRTLPLATASIILGSALAAYHHGFKTSVFILAMSTALLLQILSNFANDYGDAVHGTDNETRVGPARAIQSGALSAASVKKAVIICAILAMVSGLALLTVSLGENWRAWACFIGLGVAAVIAAITYTMGKMPYGYRGFGDVSVFLFFGLLGVAGSYYLHTGALERSVWLPAIASGLLSAAVLNINNIRDLEPDKAAGKNTLAVRLGAHLARIYHQLLVVGALVAFVIFVSEVHGYAGYLVLLAAIPLVKSGWTVYRSQDPKILDGLLKTTAKLSLLANVTLSVGLLISMHPL
ncbi:1,4-dihydroxy-2-naphthoate polyprenyltransferase [Celerinatantimonas diazotrophica]|uniref:1,4-dihydroxy-2-naphthoate octaprenyltransferase n=1 Tax=Celerinatantimonas diazotrophica TaxID=412034 RepID=A0A4R1J864_9GAMM|nr:1,4-dihydroxy-2-naphthoate polyprenyltransferase [Celerinatantimonas diazotrophica]TCK46640.1 1,4-dihydroxy-2-naphthoate prenyltransferase [Celerinatantimonas diazotrophica]CAG9295342.1 1,4-dihydroxy-2-naphthoate octaprenyltransferase [Celerinatantimonas diazotrophica]